MSEWCFGDLMIGDSVIWRFSDLVVRHWLSVTWRFGDLVIRRFDDWVSDD
jgi:hypothetical protein